MPHPLDTLFAPGSIALIGASRDLEKIPGRLLSMLRKNNYPGKIYPINPNYGDIDGLRVYPSIADVGEPIDLAIVIIPARAVLGALEQCAAVGVKNAVIISSGFAEEGGDSAAMQDGIVALAKKTGMRISGPNAEGFLSEVQKVAATFSPTVDVKPGQVPLVATRRRIGIVAQSGGIGFAIKHRAKAIGVAISYCVSAGNESDLGAGEFLEYMVQDASTDVILLFIEAIRDVDKFMAAAKRAAEVGKPVIVTKVGRSGAGQRAAASHTASMAGWSAAYDAVFAKYGFIVSNDLDEAVTIAAILTTNPLPKGDRVAVLTVSGGAGIWGADTVSMQGLQVPELSKPIQAEIGALPLRDISAHLTSATLSEFDSKSLLREAGIALPDEVLVAEKSALDTAIARVGFPLAMKIQSRDIPHKSEVGGVRVNVATKGEVFLAYEALLESARRHRPKAVIQGVLVGPMAKKGVEIIVGTLLDATFGPMIMVGLGGITTELFRDVIYRPAPVSAAEASAMLAALKAAPLLNGFRGAAKTDIPALSQLIAQISMLAERLRGDVAEIELNPVLVHPQGQGVTIVDALVVG